MLVGERHHQVAADPRLDVLGGEVGLGGARRVARQRLLGAVAAVAVERPCERLLVGGHRVLDRDLDQLGAEVGGDRAGVGLGLVAGVGGGHDHAADALGAERVDGDQRHQRRVDSARERDADMAEAVLAHVVAQPEDERRVDLGEVGQRLGAACRRRRRDLADQQLLVELGGAGDDLAVGVDDEAVAVEDQLVLAADQVAEGEVGAVGAGALGEHRLALARPCRGGRGSPRG